jgi:hypothetical protein
MIRSDEELRIAQECIANLERVLAEARRSHTPAQYQSLSAPILLELQQRHEEIVGYLIEPASQASVPEST